MISHYGVMCHMGVGEKVVVGANAGGHFRGGRPVYGDELAECVSVSDPGMGGLASVFEILASCTDGGEGIEFVVLADGDWPFHHEVGMEMTAGADPDPVADHAVGTDFDTGPEFGLGRDDGSGMNHDGAVEAGKSLRECRLGERLGFPKFFTAEAGRPDD